MGIYALSEQIDRKQLQLKKYNAPHHGELYKGNGWGASQFKVSPPYTNNSRIWSGFEMLYPKAEENTDWANIYDLVSFVINSSNANFEKSIAPEFDIGNAVDYFILLNLLRATDNTGKNTFIAKYAQNEPYFYVPWDLDGTLGTIWNGERENICNDILTNGLYDRLLNSNDSIFNKPAANRWFELRLNLLSMDNLYGAFSEQYDFLLSNGNYQRESLKWGIESIDPSNLEYTFYWLQSRLEFLDDYFGFTILNKTQATIEYKIVPNPVLSDFRLNACHEISNYSIYDINGKLIKHGSLPQNESVNIQCLSNGTYLLRINATEDAQITNLKFIKQ